MKKNIKDKEAVFEELKEQQIDENVENKTEQKKEVSEENEVTEEKKVSNQEKKDIEEAKVDVEKKEEKTKSKQTSSKSKKATKSKKNKDSSKELSKIKDELIKKEAELVKIEEERNALNDKFLRMQAEFDNYRKRTIKEKMDIVKSGGENVLKDLLPILDDLDLAITHIDKADDVESLKTGIQLIKNKFATFIQSKGLSEVEALHQEFDTDKHEALTKIPVEDENLKGKIVEVLQKGYKLNEKVIRFAKVVIGE